ncbi:MAG TPA: rRNA maturation RNase YbeY [Ktedonobacterales bacterium]
MADDAPTPAPVVEITIEDAGEDAGEDAAAGGPAGAQGGLLGLAAADIERVVALALARAGIARAVELSVVVTSDAALRQLNRDYRGRDEATDVLSFPLLDAPLAQAPADQLWGGDTLEDERDDAGGDAIASDQHTSDEDEEEDGADEPYVFVAPPTDALHLGDIVIARGVARQQAEAAGHAASWELAYLVAHGVLHLVGYDDHTDAGYTAMVAHQEAVLREAGISRAP